MDARTPRALRTYTSTTDALDLGPRRSPGVLMVVGIVGAVLLVVAEVTGSFSLGASGIALVGLCLVAAGVLAWRDARRRDRSVGRALRESVGEVFRWLWLLW